MRIVVLLCLLGMASGSLAESLFNEQGYRDKHYRRATPDYPPTGRLLTTRQLQDLIQTTAPILIDVQAITVRPETEEFGFAWLPNRTRTHIRGSTWLPNVGYGELDQRMTEYFQTNLQRLSEGNKDRALVFYCVVDCWMSWNAVRRAAEWGYTNLYWYPQGTDGWEGAGLELVEGTPYPMVMDQAANAEFFQHYGRLDLVDLAQQAEASERDLLLFFETDFCPFCTRMKKTVLPKPGLIERLQADFIAVAINIESDDIMHDEAGKKVTQRQYAQNRYRIVRTPTMIFLDSEFDMLHKHSGLVATVDEMSRLLDFVASRAYDSQSWQQYKKR